MIYRISILVTLCCFAFTGKAQLSIDSIITPASLQQIVETLSADSFQGRFTGSQESLQAGLFIAGEFEKAGALPMAGNQGYLMHIDTAGKAANIMAVLPGRSMADEMVIFSAHYDHIGNKDSEFTKHAPEKGSPENGDRIYNGANDNASGVSGLIHLLRYYSQQKNNERTLVFIAFSGEELGLLGSEFAARKFNPRLVKAMINMDMIGRPFSKKNDHPFITGAKFSDLQSMMNKQLFLLAPEYGEHYFKPDRLIGERLFMRSDNYWFALKSIPAHTIMATSPSDKYYHSLNDEAGTLDYTLMATVVKAIALGSTGFVTGADTPERISPGVFRF